MRQNGIAIIYTCLDGAFLDDNDYSFRESERALRAAQARGIPVIFCSSKTRAETESLRKAAGVNDPFIVENGGAIYAPEGYFPFTVEDGMSRDGYEVIELGESYSRLVALFRLLRAGSSNFDVVGFSDLTVNELALECRMTLDEARRAKVTIPIMVKRPSGALQSELAAQFPQALLTENAGPAGWAEIVTRLTSGKI